MKQLLALTCFIFLCALRCCAQQQLKSNPVMYLDVGVGAAFSGIDGLSLTSSLNWQHKQNLVTARIAGVLSVTETAAELAPFIAFPFFRDAGHMTEASLMDGWRTVKGGHSFSLSAGISYGSLSIPYYYPNSNRLAETLRYKYAGIPFEANVLWFKPRRERYHIYQIFPVGRPTAFGHSYGFKISGNISSHSYASFGVILGWGFHRNYANAL
jgi:hypothetical protein